MAKENNIGMMVLFMKGIITNNVKKKNFNLYIYIYRYWKNNMATGKGRFH